MDDYRDSAKMQNRSYKSISCVEKEADVGTSSPRMKARKYGARERLHCSVPNGRHVNEPHSTIEVRSFGAASASDRHLVTSLNEPGSNLLNRRFEAAIRCGNTTSAEHKYLQAGRSVLG
jgi:hypothetical protein